MSGIITQIAVKYAVENLTTNANDLMYEHLVTQEWDELLHSLESEWQVKDEFLRSYRSFYPALTRLRPHEFDALNEELSALGDDQNDLIDKLDGVLIDTMYNALVQLIGNYLDNGFGTWTFDGSNFTPAEFMRAVNSAVCSCTSSDNYFNKLVHACERFYDEVISEDELDIMTLDCDIEDWVKYKVKFDNFNAEK